MYRSRWRVHRSDAALRTAAERVLESGSVEAGRYGWFDVQAVHLSDECVLVETARLGIEGLLYCPDRTEPS